MARALLGLLPPTNQLDRTVRWRIAGSIQYVVDQAGVQLDFDRSALNAALDRIRLVPGHPGVAARYYDLVFAVTSNRFDVANELIADLVSLTKDPVEFSILPFTREILGEDFDRFQRLLFAESPSAGPLAPPSSDQFVSANQNLQHALSIIQKVDQSVYEEIVNLFRHVYVCSDSKEATRASFGGVTSFMVWGASFVNIKAYQSIIDMVQFLVHEVTHALLFGLSCDEPLVLNPAAENYRSPLRKDPRPMDGIYHATLVCARLAAFNEAWLSFPLSIKDGREEVEKHFKHTLARFNDACTTIDQSGKLSVQGRELFERCRTELAKAA